MSELTRCNRCKLDDIKRRHSGSVVTLTRDEHGWFRVRVDGEPIGVSFLQVTEGCVC